MEVQVWAAAGPAAKNRTPSTVSKAAEWLKMRLVIMSPTQEQAAGQPTETPAPDRHGVRITLALRNLGEGRAKATTVTRSAQHRIARLDAGAGAKAFAQPLPQSLA